MSRINSSIHSPASSVVRDGVELANGFLGVVAGVHVAVRVTRAQEPDASGLTVLVESFGGHGEQLASPVERVVPAAAVPEGLVLDPAPALVDFLVGQLDQMERVGDLGRPGQRRVEGLAVGTREVEGGVLDAKAPVTGAALDPDSRLLAVATRHDVE
jgi:hypothetical protein